MLCVPKLALCRDLDSRVKACIVEGISTPHADELIDWSSIAQLMLRCEYILGTRGVVDQENMQQKLVSRVESVGKASSYTPLW